MQYRWTGVGRRNPIALHADSSQSHRPRDSNVASSRPDETAVAAAASASPPPLPLGRCGTPSSATMALWIMTRGAFFSLSVLALVVFLGFFFFREAFLTVFDVAVSPAGNPASAPASRAVASRSLSSSSSCSGGVGVQYFQACLACLR